VPIKNPEEAMSASSLNQVSTFGGQILPAKKPTPAAMPADPLSLILASGGHNLPAEKPNPAAMSAEPQVPVYKGHILPTSTLNQTTTDQIITVRRNQKNTRQLILLTANRVYDVLARSQPSRRKLESLVVELNQLMDEAITFHNFLVRYSGIERKKLEDQRSSHLAYRLLIAEVEDHVQDYLHFRANDAASSSTGASSLPTADLKPVSPVPSQNETQQAISSVPEASETSTKADDNSAFGALATRTHHSGGRDLSVLPERPKVVRIPRRRPIHASHDPLNDGVIDTREPVSTLEPAPDDWIIPYCDDIDRPLPCINRRDNSSVKVKLEPFSGQSLEWFTWIDQFRSLVHLTSMEPGEKLALLHSFVTFDAKYCIAGLGGSEAAYKQALRRLFQTYGRRGVMRVSIRVALSELKLSHDDPTSYQRYADRTRNYLFDLSRIGETCPSDVVDGICNRLRLEDRLAWNMERRVNMQPLCLNYFGAWLTNRAAAYQTDEGVAAAQRASALSRRSEAERHLPPPFKSTERRHPSTHYSRGFHESSDQP